MATQSVLNRNYFKIIDAASHKTYDGCDQEWFLTDWQRISGCGPSAAANIILYMAQKGDQYISEENIHSKSECLLLMEEIWYYVTPTKEGISSTQVFCDSVLAFLKSKGRSLKCQRMDFPETMKDWPKLKEAQQFIEQALLKDMPIAFLNLCNGQEMKLEGWHWVTIISLEQKDVGGNIWLEVLDEGNIKSIDFSLWYHTTTKGGGLVYFTAI